MSRWSLIEVAAAASLAVAGVAAAQEAPPTAAPTKDKAAVTFNEVERGVYLGAFAGPLFIVNAPATSGPRPFSTGQMAQVELGVDIGDRLSVGLFFTGTASHEGASFTGSSGGTASGDFAMLVPGATARVNLVGFPDSQGTTRTYVYVRAGAGYVFYSPPQLMKGARDVQAFAGGGVEYYTRLRHFSIGVELSGTVLLPSTTFGFSVTPSLRYAF